MDSLTQDTSEIVLKPYNWFKPHPQNQALFGAPDKNPQLLEEIMTSIEQQGLQEPLVALPDGTLLSGHLRHFALAKVAEVRGESLDELMVPTRIHEAFKSSGAELTWLIDANLRRRQLSRRQIGVLFTYLNSLDGKPVVDKTKKKKIAAIVKSNHAKNAKKLGVTPERAKNLSTIYATEGVPEEVIEKVESGKIAEVRAARAIANTIRQGMVVDKEKLVEKINELVETPEPVTPMEERLEEVHDLLKKAISAPAQDGSKARALLGLIYNEAHEALFKVPLRRETGVPLCSVCHEPQWASSGPTCKNGHGGAPSVFEYQPTIPEPQEPGVVSVKPSIQAEDFDTDALLKSI